MGTSEQPGTGTAVAVELAPIDVLRVHPDTTGAATTALTPTQTDAAATTASSPVAGMNTAYLEYLREINKKWTDCPSVELVFKDLAYAHHNESTIADARSVKARRARASTSASAVPSKAEENIPTLAKSFTEIALTPVRIAQAVRNAISKPTPDPDEVLYALAPCSGVIRPGTMTLVLAPPGGGKSTFLRALTGRLNGDAGLTGEVYFNGLTVPEAKERGVYVTRLCSYVGQGDVSFPTLTVTETLEFARMNGVGDVKLLRSNPNEPNVELEEMDARRSTLLMELLGMMECKDTIIGSDLLRGISGGQKKRAAIGESLMSNARLYALDEVSNGLDSAVTLHIFDALKQASQLNQSSVITALQQVTPETYALFDEVVLMREGRILYHGPRTQVHAWLEEVMGIPFIPSALEEAGFLIDLLSDPKQALEKAATAHRVALAAQRSQEGASGSPAISAAMVAPTTMTEQKTSDDSESVENSKSTAARVTFHVGQDDAPTVAQASPKSLVVKKTKLVYDPEKPFAKSATQLESLQDVDTLEATYLASSIGQRIANEVEGVLARRQEKAGATMDTSKWGPYTKSQYGQQFPHSTAYHTLLCCQRQVKLQGRSLTMIIPRLFSAAFMGFIYGTLFFQLAHDDFQSKLGLALSAVMFMGFANFQELPIASEAKQVVVRQTDAGFFPAISYTIAVNLLTFPLAIAEIVIYGTLVYWVPSFVAEPDRYFFWLFVLLTISSAMSQMFRAITYLSANPDMAHQMNMPFIMLFVVFGGFLIPRTSVPDWLIWAYYLSPFQWAMTAASINEFTSGVYKGYTTDSLEHGQTEGEYFLDSFGLRYEKVWQWAAIAYLWGFYIVITLFSTFVLMRLKPTVTMGAKRALSTKKRVAPGASKAVLADTNAVVIDVQSGAASKAKQLASGGAKSSARASFQLSALPFTPATLAWKDIKYTVYVGKEKTPKVLLNRISGYAEPGKMTALMGASGAGKTTLMDVIAGRKTTGLIEDEKNIFVNGRPKDDTFQHITAYCEQTDLHNGQATVKEALQFSARLRLPASVDETTREAFITEVMDLVGLTNIQNRMVGDVSQPSLSSGQLKLLTIAVELVANPSILFLDEPTSGLDAKSAYRVMRAIKRIAATNRTIVCTIHQPSQEVFFMFDRLLLLRRGGETVYFDDLGQNGSKIVEYMTRVSQNLMPYSELVSPANWMLDVIALDATSLVAEQKEEEEKRAAEQAADTKAHHKEVAHAEGAPLQNVASTSPVIGDEAVAKAFKAKVLAAARSSAGRGYASTRSEAELEQAKPILFAEEWSRSAEAIEASTVIAKYSQARGEAAGSEHTNVVYAPGIVRLYEVVLRGFRSHWRSPFVNVTRFGLMFIIGLFLGLVYRDTHVNDFTGLSTLLAAIFLSISLPAYICSNASLSMFFRQRPVYYREASVKMYGYKIYAASMSIIEIPFHLVGLFCFLLPFYFLVGLENTGAQFFKFYLIGFLMILFFHLLDQTSVSGLPNMIAAQAVSGFFISMFFAFGGLYIKPSRIPIGWQWFYYIDPIPKAFIAVITDQLDCANGGEDGGGNIDGCRMLTVPGETGEHQVYRYVSDLLDGDAHQYWYMIGWLLLSIFVLRIFSIFLFKTVNHIDR